MDAFDPQDRLVDALLSELAGDRPSPDLRRRTLQQAFPESAGPRIASDPRSAVARPPAIEGTRVVRRQPRPVRIGPFRQPTAWALGAAGTVVALLLGWRALVEPASLEPAGQCKPAESPPSLPRADRTPSAPVELAGGCRIEPAGSACYRIAGPRYVVLQRGRLYVEVDRRRAGWEPFVVATPAGEARASGTRFVVETDRVAPRDPPDSSSPVPPRIPLPVPQGDVKMGSASQGLKFLTQVLVLAGMVHLVSADAQIEGRAGEILQVEADQPDALGAVEVQASVAANGAAAGPGLIVVQAGEERRVQVIQPGLGQGGAAAVGRGNQPQMYQAFSLPGYWSLYEEATRKEIELTDEQEKQLREIAKQYMEKMQGLYSPEAWQKKDMTQEERMKLFNEMRTKSQELQTWAKAEADKVLLPHQIAAMEKINMRRMAAGVLMSPWALDRLGLSDEQKAKVKANRDELSKKVRKLEVEAFEELLEVLTPEQIEKLKDPAKIWSQVQPAQKP